MRDPTERRPWWPTRMLQSLVRGPGAEYLRGDLHESWRRMVETSGVRWRAEVRHLGDVVRTVARWWSPNAARRRARHDFDYDEVREARTRGGGGMGDIGSAVRIALRGLRRRPGFTVVTLATLGLGIGATTTVLSVVDGVMLRPLPYPDSDRLVAVGATFPSSEWVDGVDDLQHLAGVSLANYEVLRERSRALAELAGAEVASALLPDEGDGPRIVPLARVTEGFFDVLQADLEVGRQFAPEEFRASDVPPVILSYTTWQARFGGDPAVIGRALPGPTGASSSTVIGVLAPSFVPPENMGLARVEFWQPLDPTHPRYDNRGSRSLSLIGRLAPDATVAAARTELTALAAEIAREYPEGSVYPDGSWFGYGANGLRADMVGTTRRPLMVFFGAAALLFLISAMNAANLLLVRTSDRVGELSVRRALGAGRRVLVGQVLLESLLLGLGGGLLGVLVALVGMEAFLALTPRVPRMDEIGMNGRILSLAVAVSIGAGVLIGVAPAIGAGRRDPARALRASTAGAGTGGSRLRTALVTAQLGLALLLGIGASVLMHSFVNVASVRPGFDPEGLVSFRLATKQPGGPDETWSVWDETLRAVRGVPGLTGVTGVSNLPFEDPNWAPGLRFPGESELDVRTGLAGYAVAPGYFEVMGQRVREGRGILDADGPDAEPVAVVNRALVQRDFGDRPVLGATVHMGGEGVAFRIVGIVDDVVVRRAEEGPRPALYIPYTQIDWPWVKVVVRSDRPFGDLATDLRQAAATVSPIVPIQDLVRLEDRIRTVETEPRFQAFLIATFALAALLLATVGLYGTLAHTVGRRRREIGVRLALGAEPSRVFGMILRHGVMVAGAGAVIGVAGAALLARVLERFLFDVPALDPISFGVGLAALALATVAAVLRPALRATRVDVVGSLRAE